MIKKVIKYISNSPYSSQLFYNHRCYKLQKTDDDFEWFQTKTNRPERMTLTDEKKKVIQHWFDSTKSFITRSYMMTEKSQSLLKARKLNDFEALAVTCYQIWADFFMNPSSRFDKFTIEDFIKFIELKYHGRTSLLELLDYFHKNLRKKMIAANKEDIFSSNDMVYENEFESLMGDYGFSDTEYSIIYYEDSDEPYSCIVKTEDYDKTEKIIQGIKNNDEFIVDRCSSRRISDDIALYSFRIRKKYKQVTESIMRKLVYQSIMDLFD